MISLNVGPWFDFWRRLTLVVSVVLMADAAQAENKTVFIRKPVIGRGVSAVVGQKFRDIIRVYR